MASGGQHHVQPAGSQLAVSSPCSHHSASVIVLLSSETQLETASSSFYTMSVLGPSMTHSAINRRVEPVRGSTFLHDLHVPAAARAVGTGDDDVCSAAGAGRYHGRSADGTAGILYNR